MRTSIGDSAWREKIDAILAMSKAVIEDCSLDNGAIVAANPKDPDYPKGLKKYFYVWPRDASFACVACGILGIRKIPEKFFDWCWNAQNFRKTGRMYMRYHPTGKMYGRQFQPDQSGALLWALRLHSERWKTDRFDDLAEKVADGLCSSWNGSCFRRSYDLWEERVAFPGKSENFTYSLSICIRGLEDAVKMTGGKDLWRSCLNQMKERFPESYDKKSGRYARKFNGEMDIRSDSSLLGLVWPSGLLMPKDSAVVRTVKRIEEENGTEGGGIMRYKGDRYAGSLMRKEGGAWPLLNFWMSMYYLKAGNRKESLKYFNWVIDRVESKLPEQIKNGRPASINPLVWSHSMFVIVGNALGLF